MSDRRDFLHATTIVAVITAFSRLLGMVRDIAVGALMGAGRVSDVFWIAFELPNLARRALGEGALSAFIVPLFAAERREKGPEQAWRYASSALNAIFLLGAALTILGTLFSRELFMAFGGLGMLLRDNAAAGLDEPQAIALGAQLTRIMFPYLMLLGVAATLMGLCHAMRRFAAPAFGSVLLNLSMISTGLIFWALNRGQTQWNVAQKVRLAHWLAIAVLAGIVLRVLVHIPALWREGFRYRLILEPKNPRLAELFRKLPLACLGLLMAQLMISVNKFFAMFMDDGYVTQLTYASRVTQLPLGILASAMATSILPQLTHHLHEGRTASMQALFGFAMRATVILFLPATVGLIVLREPIVALLFERLNWTADDTAGAAWAMLFYALGLAPMAALQLVVPLYYARLNLRDPLKASAVAIVLNIALNAVFMTTALRQGGLALATSLSTAVNLGLLLHWQPGGVRQMAHWRLGGTLVRCAAATLAMAAAEAGFQAVIESRFGLLQSTTARAAFVATAVPLGAGVYFAVAWLLKTPDLRAVAAILGRRGDKPASGA